MEQVKLSQKRIRKIACAGLCTWGLSFAAVAGDLQIECMFEPKFDQKAIREHTKARLLFSKFTKFCVAENPANNRCSMTPLWKGWYKGSLDTNKKTVSWLPEKQDGEKSLTVTCKYKHKKESKKKETGKSEK